MSTPGELALNRLPHGKEFRFLHRLTALDPGQSGTAEYDLREQLDFLKGHFPGQPLMPGVLLLEGCAQLAGVVAQADPARAPLADLRLTAIRSAKILGTAVPGQTIVFQAQISARLGNLIQAATSAHLNGALILSAEITLSGRLPADHEKSMS